MSIRTCVLCFLLLGPAGAFAAPASLTAVPGVDDAGHATALWQEMIRKRLPEERFEAIEHLEKPFTAGEAAWAGLVRSRLETWEAEIPALTRVFRPLPAPDARIVLGNRGGDDGFTHAAHTIGFDLERLDFAYGDATAAENIDRIDRIFRHEYTHLLQKAWLAEHPYAVESPLQAAILGTWLEGAGNYYSMSERWRATKGMPSAKAGKTLAILAPRFVARLAALACASDEDGDRLMADLSRGRFDRKWGALTVALWIEQDASISEDALRNFVLAGPEGVWAFAERHLPAAMKPILDEIKTAAAICNER